MAADADEPGRYLSPMKAAKMLDVSTDTLRKWAREGKVRCLRTPGQRRRYLLADLQKLLTSEDK